jgi:hypothetical protein
MRRGWIAAAILMILSAVVAQEVRFSSPGSRTKFRKPLPKLYPYALAGGQFSDFLREAGLTVFSFHPAARYYLPASTRRIDFTRIVGGGVRTDLSPRVAVFLECRYFAGLVNLARAVLPHVDYKNLRLRPGSMQVGFRYLLSGPDH